MEPMPLCIDSLCQDCGNKWESEEWRGKCPKCGSQNISQKAIIKNN
jgi:Zn finger protein HypA/HybF involved in hydrogenase expression